MINWIITSSILIVGVIILRRILRGRISLRLQYALWGLVLLRLLLPVSVGTTTFSVENTVQSVPAVQHFAQRMASPAQSGNPEKPAAPAEPAASASASAAPEAPAQTVEPVQAEEPAQTEKPVREVKSSLTQVQIMRIVWLGGAALVGAAFAAANLCFALRLRRSRRRLNVENSRLPVYVSDVPESPCLFGLFRPAVYLTPETTQDATALRHALAHETTHFRHGDPVWSALRCVCLTLHWFNPLVWCAAVLSRRDAELACDEATVRTLGEEERAAYGRTLLRMTCCGHSGLLTAATTMSGDEIKERILLLAKKPRTAAYTLAAVLLIAALAVGCTFTGAKEGEKPQEEPDPTTPPSSSVMTDPTEPADASEPDFNLPGTRVDAQTEAEVRQLFESPKGMYSRFTATGCEFTAPAEIDLRYLFYTALPGVDNTLSDAERAYLTSVWGKEPMMLDIDRLPVSAMNDVLQTYLGLTLEETQGKGLEYLTYWEETDCYYHWHGDTNARRISVYGVYAQEDGSLAVYYYEGTEFNEKEKPPMVLTLMAKGDGDYLVLSNLPVEVRSGEQLRNIEISRIQDHPSINGFTANVGELTDYRAIGQAWAEAYAAQHLLLPEGDPKRCTEAAVVRCEPVAVRLLSSEPEAVQYQVEFAYKPEVNDDNTGLYFLTSGSAIDETRYPQYAHSLGWYGSGNLEILLSRDGESGRWTCLSSGTGGIFGMQGFLPLEYDQAVWDDIMALLGQGDEIYWDYFLRQLPGLDWNTFHRKWGDEGWAKLISALEKYCTGEETEEDQAYRDMYVMLGALNLGLTQRRDLAPVLQKQRDFDPTTFDRCVQENFSKTQQDTILELLK